MRNFPGVLYKLLCLTLCLALCAGMTTALADGEEPVPPETAPAGSPAPEVLVSEEPAPPDGVEPTAEPTAEPEPEATEEPVTTIPPLVIQTPPAIEPAPEVAPETAPVVTEQPQDEYWDDPLWYRATQQTSAIALASADPFRAYKPRALKDGEALHKGIDVSTFQKTVDWKSVAASGMEFAFVRVAYRGSATGKLTYDSYWSQNLTGARDAGLKVGAYFFSQAVTVEEAKEEATFLVNAVQGYQIDLPLVLDFEEVGSGTGRLKMSKLDRQLMTDICNAFCQTVEAAGYESMVYSNPYTLDHYLYREKLGRLWLANYIETTTYAGEYEYWQCGTGPVSGVAGDVDLDFWFEPNGTAVPPGEGAVTPSDTPEADPNASPTPEATPTPTPEPSPTPTPDTPPVKNPFKDVKEDSWYRQSVLWAYGRGIVNGQSKTSFGANAVATRGQLVAMLYRMEGQPAVTSTAPFTDLKEDYYKDAVNWAAAEGVVGGFTPTIFAPNNKVTREQLATMLYRMSDSPAVSGSLDQFTDSASVQEYAHDAMVWAVENGIISGYPNGQIRPGSSATRAEVCTMLMRYSNL